MMETAIDRVGLRVAIYDLLEREARYMTARELGERFGIDTTTILAELRKLEASGRCYRMINPDQANRGRNGNSHIWTIEHVHTKPSGGRAQ